MSSIVLGRLKRGDVREAWDKEATAFTPWLAEEENLKLLGETIRLDLQLVATERFVGSFRADILCKDTLTSDYVLIENQLEWTDHSHLSVEKKYLDVSLVIGSNQAKRYFHLLEAQKAEIEHELGCLNWFELPERKWCYIGQYSAPFEILDKAQWHAQFAWLQERLEAFRKSSGLRVKDLYLPDTLPDTELESIA